jgi:2-keto-4-pentenoate hydratase/2-oxohepta-3-ene-1,7-dioic acid hydratase in catechol pathway
MKLASFATNGSAPRAGIIDGEDVIDLSIAAPDLPHSLAAILSAGEHGRQQLGNATRSGLGRTRLDTVRLCAPIPHPSKFLAVGLNYQDHVDEGGPRTIPEIPTVFAKMSSCTAGPFDDIERPRVSRQLDYEGELGIVIGRRCRHVGRDDAHEVIAGYLVVNDVSVRDWQVSTSQWTLGKSFDTHGPMGPWLVTSDEIEEPHNLELQTFVNDELRQHSTTALLIHDCFAIVEHISKVCALEPGDVITTGTPAGVAARMDPPRWLEPGDVVRVEIEGIGAIESRVVDEPGDEPVTASVAAEHSAA